MECHQDTGVLPVRTAAAGTGVGAQEGAEVGAGAQDAGLLMGDTLLGDTGPDPGLPPTEQHTRPTDPPTPPLGALGAEALHLGETT